MQDSTLSKVLFQFVLSLLPLLFMRTRKKTFHELSPYLCTFVILKSTDQQTTGRPSIFHNSNKTSNHSQLYPTNNSFSRDKAAILLQKADRLRGQIERDSIAQRATPLGSARGRFVTQISRAFLS